MSGDKRISCEVGAVLSRATISGRLLRNHPHQNIVMGMLEMVGRDELPPIHVAPAIVRGTSQGDVEDLRPIRYVQNLHNVLTSALLAILPNLRPEASIKEQYRNFPALRPFIQYLAHAAATSDPARAIANLEELIQQSLANHQVQSPTDSRKLRTIARAYLQQLTTGRARIVKLTKPIVEILVKS